jgi:hypothetical protein
MRGVGDSEATTSDWRDASAFNGAAGTPATVVSGSSTLSRPSSAADVSAADENGFGAGNLCASAAGLDVSTSALVKCNSR